MKTNGLAVTVHLRDLMSQPQHVKIPAKSTVVFENGEQDAQMYEISCVGMRNKPWRLKPGEKYYQTFNQPGKYELVTSPQLPSKVVVEVVDRFKSKKVYRQVAKAAKPSENQPIQALQVQQHSSDALAHADPSPSTPAQATERSENPAKKQQKDTAEDADEQAQEARETLSDQPQLRPFGKRVRSNLLERHRRQQAAAAAAAAAASSSDSSDDEYRAVMAMQRNQCKSQAQQLATHHGSLLSPQPHQQHQQPGFFKPAVASSAVLKQKIEHSATAKAAPASKKAPRSKRRVLQFARVTIKDFDFNHQNVTVAVGGTLEFVLHQSCPKLAEHQLNGESSTGELRFVSPLMGAAGCRRFRVSPAVEGEIRVSCQVYPDMVCLVRVACPSHSERNPRRGVEAVPSAIAEQGTGVFTLVDHGSQSSVGSCGRLDSDDETGLSGLYSGATSTCSSLDTCSASPNPQSTPSTSELFAEVKRRATDADAFVCVTEYGFEPSEITVGADDKLALISVSDRSHLLSCVMEHDAPLLEGVPLQLPERLVYLQFENAGTYTVQDEVFGFMKCKVHVTARTSRCDHSTKAEAEASVETAMKPILVQQNDSSVEPLPEPEAIQPVEAEAPATEGSPPKPEKQLLQRTSSQRPVKSKPKRQWKLKHSAAPRQPSPSDENAAPATEQAPERASEEQPKPAVTLHPRMQAVQEWFNNRMSEIELKLALHGYDTLPSGKRVPIIVL